MHETACQTPMVNTKISKKLSIVPEIEVGMEVIMILDTGEVVVGVVSGDQLDTGFGPIQNGMYGEIKSVENITLIMVITIKEDLLENQHMENILVSNRH